MSYEYPSLCLTRLTRYLTTTNLITLSFRYESLIFLITGRFIDIWNAGYTDCFVKILKSLQNSANYFFLQSYL